MSNVDTENAENSSNKPEAGSAEPASKWNLADLDSIPTPKAGAKAAPVAEKPAPVATQPQQPPAVPQPAPAPVKQSTPPALPPQQPVAPAPSAQAAPSASAGFNPSELDQIGRPQPVGYVETNWSSDSKPQAGGMNGMLIGVTCVLLIIGFLISQAVNNAAKDPTLKQKLESIEKSKTNSNSQNR